ncbi:hypothetical protein [Streptomyces acidicola]
MARDLQIKVTSSDPPLWTADFRLFFTARTTSFEYAGSVPEAPAPMN